MEHFDAPVHELNSDRVSDRQHTVGRDAYQLGGRAVGSVRESMHDLKEGISDHWDSNRSSVSTLGTDARNSFNGLANDARGVGADIRTATERESRRLERNMSWSPTLASPTSPSGRDPFYPRAFNGGSVNSDMFEAAANARHEYRLHQSGRHDSEHARYSTADLDARVANARMSKIRDEHQPRGFFASLGDMFRRSPSSDAEEKLRDATGRVRSVDDAGNSIRRGVDNAADSAHRSFRSASTSVGRAANNVFDIRPDDPTARLPSTYRSGSGREAPAHALSRDQFARRDPAVLTLPGDETLAVTDPSDGLAEAGAAPLRGLIAQRFPRSRSHSSSSRSIASDTAAAARGAGSSAKRVVEDAASTIGDAARSAGDTIASTTRNATDSVAHAAQRIGADVSAAARDSAWTTKETLLAARDSVAETASNVVHDVHAKVHPQESAPRGVIGTVSDTVVGGVVGAKDVVVGGVVGAKDAVVGAASSVTNAVTGAVGSAWHTITGSAKDAKDSVAETVERTTAEAKAAAARAADKAERARSSSVDAAARDAKAVAERARAAADKTARDTKLAAVVAEKDAKAAAERLAKGSAAAVEKAQREAKAAADAAARDARSAVERGRGAFQDASAEARELGREIRADVRTIGNELRASAAERSALRLREEDEIVRAARGEVNTPRMDTHRALYIESRRGRRGDHHAHMGDVGHLGGRYLRDPTRGLHRSSSPDLLDMVVDGVGRTRPLMSGDNEVDMGGVGARSLYFERNRLGVNLSNLLEEAGAPLHVAASHTTPIAVERDRVSLSDQKPAKLAAQTSRKNTVEVKPVALEVKPVTMQTGAPAPGTATVTAAPSKVTVATGGNVNVVADDSRKTQQTTAVSRDTSSASA